MPRALAAEIPGLGLDQPPDARVASVVPSAGPQQPSSSTAMSLVLTPLNPSAFSNLVPRLRFSAKVDTVSGNRNQPSAEQLG